MAQWWDCFLCESKDQSLDSSSHTKYPDMVESTYNPSLVRQRQADPGSLLAKQPSP